MCVGRTISHVSLYAFWSLLSNAQKLIAVEKFTGIWLTNSRSFCLNLAYKSYVFFITPTRFSFNFWLAYSHSLAHSCTRSIPFGVSGPSHFLLNHAFLLLTKILITRVFENIVLVAWTMQCLAEREDSFYFVILLVQFNKRM